MILTPVPLDASRIGQRVVVRYRLALRERGSAGTPGATDVLGTLVAFDADGLVVLTDDANPDLVRVAHGQVVAAKPVPPRASTLLRVSAQHLMAVCDAGWPARTVEPLGDWRLRESAGFTGRGNSALPVGDPGVPLPAALSRVAAFYAEHGLPPLAQVVLGSELESPLAEAGWQVARHAEGALVQVAPVAVARRAARSRRAASDSTDGGPVTISDRLTDGWARRYGRTCGAAIEVIRHVLAGPDSVALAAIGDPPIAIGRGVVTGDWLGLAAVEVDVELRRHGLAGRVVDALLDWGAEHGARSAYLQTMPDNTGALALYAPYGFVTHHRYRYWGPTPAPPDRDPAR